MRPFPSRPAKILGAISYSLYLTHCIVLFVVVGAADRLLGLESLGPTQYWLLVALAALATVVLSAVTFQFVEYPFMNPKGRACGPSPPKPHERHAGRGRRRDVPFARGLYWSPPQGAPDNPARVEFREAGASAAQGLEPWFDARNGEYRGSLVELKPGTSYEIRLTCRAVRAPR